MVNVNGLDFKPIGKMLAGWDIPDTEDEAVYRSLLLMVVVDAGDDGVGEDQAETILDWVRGVFFDARMIRLWSDGCVSIHPGDSSGPCFRITEKGKKQAAED